jgi:endonuclease/exonuclease/phosphatase family metal-dependent hydrolase
VNKRLKQRIGIFVTALNIICAVMLGLSIAAPWIDPAQWWLIGIAGLFFPLLFLCNGLFIVLWLFARPKMMFLSLLMLLPCIPAVRSMYAFNTSKNFAKEKVPGQVRIISWNVGLMNYTAPDSATAIKNNILIFDQLRSMDADIICLQEFLTGTAPGSHYNLIDSISTTLHYPYRYFSYDYPKFDGAFYSGNIIFSRWPITDSSKTGYPPPFSGSIIRAGVLINNDTIDILTTRLQTVHFQPAEYKSIDDIKHGADSGLAGSTTILRKLAYGYRQRSRQVDIVTALTKASKRPLIVTGDLNDVPTGYAYSNIRSGMTDAWLAKGSGLGRTFRFIAPTLRIDYIFFNRAFTATQTNRLITTASDHYGLVSDLSFQ